jgi:hypothetical protein
VNFGPEFVLKYLGSREILSGFSVKFARFSRKNSARYAFWSNFAVNLRLAQPLQQ